MTGVSIDAEIGSAPVLVVIVEKEDCDDLDVDVVDVDAGREIAGEIKPAEGVLVRSASLA